MQNVGGGDMYRWFRRALSALLLEGCYKLLGRQVDLLQGALLLLCYTRERKPNTHAIRAIPVLALAQIRQAAQNNNAQGLRTTRIGDQNDLRRLEEQRR